MRYDISDTLTTAKKAEWERDVGKHMVEWLASCLPASIVDWDEGAGEDWACFFTDDQVTVLLWMRGPLAIVLVDFEQIASLLVERQVAVVPVPDMDEDCLCCERSVLTDFAGRPISQAIDLAHFSAKDLAWATI